MKESDDKDGVIDLIHMSNEGCEMGRKPGYWVIGDSEYTPSVLADS